MKNYLKFNYLLIITLILISANLLAQVTDTKSSPVGNEKRIQEWKDARFGMFIHWGPVSIKGTEIGWSRGAQVPIEEYDNLYKQFNPVGFNADEWVSIAKAAGMRYIVLTTKHHDGFSLWNTRQNDYNIMNTPFKRDVVKELSEACRKQGIEFGTYYSTCDWRNPDFPLTSPGGTIERKKYDLDAYTSYLKRQVGELLLNYGPLYVLWFDMPQKFDAVRGQGIIDFAHSLQPNIIINNRTGAKGDFDTPEQKVGGFQIDRPWETCMTIGRQWSFKPNDEVKSLEQCLQSLIRSAGGDGNLLFNVGPRPDGKIEPLQVERLKEMGHWLENYGTSIYGTRGGPFKPTDWGVSTRKGNKIYLHILKWFGKSVRLTIPDVGMEIKSCKLITGGNLKFTKLTSGYQIDFGGELLQPVNTIIELEVAGNALDIKPCDIQSQSLSFNKPATGSTNPNPGWNGVASINNGDWVGHFWQPAKEDKAPWAEIDLGKPQKLSKAIIYESGRNVKSFKLQYLKEKDWKTMSKGTTIGEKVEVKLPGVIAQKVRLVLTGFDNTPGIYEMILL